MVGAKPILEDIDQLGNNNETSYSSPTQVGTDTDWIAVTNMGSNILFNRSLS